MTWKTYSYEMQILEKHIDSFGHVNNAAYLEIMEEARWDFITKNGYGYREVHSRKIGPVVLELTLRFKRELLLREKIRIDSITISYVGKVGHISQKIFGLDGELKAEATFVVGLFDLNSRKLIKPTPEWLRAIGSAEPAN